MLLFLTFIVSNLLIQLLEYDYIFIDLIVFWLASQGNSYYLVKNVDIISNGGKFSLPIVHAVFLFFNSKFINNYNVLKVFESATFFNTRLFLCSMIFFFILSLDRSNFYLEYLNIYFNGILFIPFFLYSFRCSRTFSQKCECIFQLRRNGTYLEKVVDFCCANIENATAIHDFAILYDYSIASQLISKRHLPMLNRARAKFQDSPSKVTMLDKMIKCIED